MPKNHCQGVPISAKEEKGGTPMRITPRSWRPMILQSFLLALLRRVKKMDPGLPWSPR
ncbi:hypothetical protein L195_g038798 [Trifolium pratense]|uniref:Uncharacterized protein n=1 Tax=Trifolium pratense TaxID=57577 RepID=A0A2K3LW67_TRIPR|nr:hypothetical protein L195_g038798 [Trifolium pratense]